MEYIMAFGSAHRALKAEEALKEAGAPFRLLPAPKALEPYCDLVISVSVVEFIRVAGILKDAGISPKSVYRKEGDEYVKV